ncbi:hypothetical protein VNO80_24717 [Phaseolus coccineus]|uniref:Uncharacterized protein n=1 Tax=Phaseolus coccineus TaxID=3886 RepID=A0AAN9QSM2_PHACN
MQEELHPSNKWELSKTSEVDYGERVVDVWGPMVRWGPLIVASTREGPLFLLPHFACSPFYTYLPPLSLLSQLLSYTHKHTTHTHIHNLAKALTF